MTLPLAPGHHTLKCNTWSPRGGFLDHLTRTFIGGGPQFNPKNTAEKPGQWFKINSVSMGIVTVNISVVLFNFSRFNIEC